MSTTIRCGCGTTLRVPASAAGKMVSCPKCKQKVRVPETTATSPASAASHSQGQAAQSSATPAVSAESILISCACGAAMKVAAEHVGKAVACPKCNQQMIVPGPGASLAQAAMPEVPPEPEPDIFGGLPDAFAGTTTAGSLHTSVPAPAYRSAPKKRRKPGANSAAGSLVAMVGVCIMIAGLISCCVGLACFHFVLVRSIAQRDSVQELRSSDAMNTQMSGLNPAERFSKMREIRNKLVAEQASFAKTSNSLREVFKYGMKIGRPVLAVGGLVAAIGYGISIGTGGAQMGLAIAALIVAILGGILDLIQRVIPWLTEDRKMPSDIFLLNIGRFGFREDNTLEMAAIEVLMAGHIILFSIYALLGYQGRKNREGSGLAITAIATGGIYLVMILVLSIMLSDPGESSGFLYTLLGMYWVANALILTAMGFLIGSLLKLRG